MRTLAEFVKTTLIGGLLIILPIYVSVILIAKAVHRSSRSKRHKRSFADTRANGKAAAIPAVPGAPI